MTKEMQTYLEWRCRMNWHPKYYKYIQEWIVNVLPYQIEYFEKEWVMRLGAHMDIENAIDVFNRQCLSYQ